MDGEGNLVAVELFAGAGGLLLGTSLAGFKHLAAAEWEHNCCNTLRLNQRKGHPLIDGGMRIIEGDVRDVDWSFLPGGIDLLAGGPPASRSRSVASRARRRTGGTCSRPTPPCSPG